MALAKVGGLAALFRLFPRVLTPPAVFAELVTAGLRLGAPDAVFLESRYRSQELQVISPAGATLPAPTRLGLGEEQSILLAIEQNAAWLLIDDLDARRAALANLAVAGAETGLKGTLGVILSAREHGYLSMEEAAGLVQSLRERPDIWISDGLCDRALDLLKKG
jgi:predicted nucleic acid-binding protein